MRVVQVLGGDSCLHLSTMAMAAQAAWYLDAKMQHNAGGRKITPGLPRPLCVRSRHCTRFHGRTLFVGAGMSRGLERSNGTDQFVGVRFVPRRRSGMQTHLTPTATLSEETNSGFSKVVTRFR